MNRITTNSSAGSLPLTRRQHEILVFYRAYVNEHGFSPTLEEVAQHFGVNKVTIFGHVAELERKGALSRAARGVSRAVRVVESPAAVSAAAVSAAGVSAAASVTAAESTSAARSAEVSILGRIAAGQPIEALEDAEVFDLADMLPEGRDVYALRVRGQSMIDDGIHDGDVVLIERRSNARDGEMVVAVLPDNEATLKRIYREPAGFRLEPSNASMQPIHVAEVEVRGAVIGVVRKY